MWFSFSFQGIEVLQQLRSLNLSHNALRSVDGLAMNSVLVELRLAVNEIQDISSMPSLLNLKILDVSNNKVTCPVVLLTDGDTQFVSLQNSVCFPTRLIFVC